MRRVLALAVAASALAIAPTAVKADPPKVEGRYRVSVEMDMPGMPLKLPPSSRVGDATTTKSVPTRASPTSPPQSSNTKSTQHQQGPKQPFFNGSLGPTKPGRSPPGMRPFQTGDAVFDRAFRTCAEEGVSAATLLQ